MILLDKKITIFDNIIYDKTKDECDERVREFEDERELRIREKKLEIEKVSRDIVSRKTKIASENRYERLAKANEHRRIQELQKGNSLVDSLIADLVVKTEEFTKSAEYKDYLLGMADKLFLTLKPSKHRLGMTKRDMDRYFDPIVDLGRVYGLNFEPYTIDDNLIGGIIISDLEGAYNINSTLLEKIEDNRYEIGKILYLTLKEVGDLNEV